MLMQIHIRDFATIEKLQLNLEHGNTMITGETGAGKSIFIEAIEIALGGRASASIIRPGKEKAEIALCFDLTEFPHVQTLLKENDLLIEATECIIRRVISNDGRSRCYINGIPTTLNYVKELGEKLFHLHGQHEQQVLLKSDAQREMLDRYADHLTLTYEVKELANDWKNIHQQIKNLQEKKEERSKRIDYLTFQLEELEIVKLEKGSYERLESEHKRLSHAEELTHCIQQVIEHINHDQEHNILNILNEIRRQIESIQAYENKSHEWINVVNSVIIQLNDLSAELNYYLEKAEIEPEKLRAVEEEISQLFNLARKHKVPPQDLLFFKDKLKEELTKLNSSDENLAQLEQQKKEIEIQYATLANKLSNSRKKAAKNLAQEITTTIRSLSLPHGEFKIEFEEYDSSEKSAHGNEKIIFLIKTNPDQHLQSLSKVISGGELSRLSLALHLALAKNTTIPTLIFDEVDTGLSGATAEKIGRLLRKLGESYQVFCVTHQAQVAACGHHHLLVEKKVITNTTHTHLRLLNTKEKTAEIARMLGGEKITEKTLAHAREVLQSA